MPSDIMFTNVIQKMWKRQNVISEKSEIQFLIFEQ